MRLMGMASLPARDPMDDRWWSDWTGAASVAGVYVDADKALKISAAWACVGLLSETIAGLPFGMYRRRADEGREPANNHPLHKVLHNLPNETQTAFEFREMMTGHALLRGNAYALIQPGARGAVDQLIPIHPDRVVKVEKLPNGRLRYQIRQADGSQKPYNQEDIFHLRGLSTDGVKGVSVIDYARDSMGMTLAAEQYGGRFFRNDSRPGGVLRTQQKLSEKAAERLKTSWEAAHAAGNQNRVAVLEEGLEWQQVGITPEAAQFLGTREFQAEDVCRWFRVPPHMVGLTSKSTSWGSGIEQMSIGFVTYTLLPWLTRWRQAVERSLILAPDTYFADFIVEGLLRGDVDSRYRAYATGRQWGWLSVNDIRRLENMNPVDNGDIYLQPMNMTPAGMELAAVDAPPLQANGHGENGAEVFARKHYQLLADEAAGRVVRKELAALGRASRQANGDRAAWAQAVFDFYSDHAAFVAQAMRIPLATATAFVEAGQRELLTDGPMALQFDWETRRAQALAALAVGELA